MEIPCNDTQLILIKENVIILVFLNELVIFVKNNDFKYEVRAIHVEAKSIKCVDLIYNTDMIVISTDNFLKIVKLK